MQAFSNTYAPIGSDCATILASIELSRRTWVVTVHSPDRDRISRYKLQGGEHGALLGLFEKLRTRAERILGRAARIVSCYEAGYDGFWLHRSLCAAGIDNLVFDPASIAVERRSRRAKTDRIDGELLLRTLMAYQRGEPRVVRVVRVPSREHEDARRSTRERERLIKEHTGHINRIKGLLRTLGLKGGHPQKADWPGWLEQQRDWQDRPVPPRLLAELKREHARLMLVREQLAALAAEPAASVAIGQIVARLTQFKGIGPVFATTLASEVLYKEFANRREVAGYCGLSPSPWQSGDVDFDQGISKAGNPRARHTLVELAWLWLQHQPDSALSQWFRNYVANAGSRRRRVAIVALARRILVALWRYLTTGLIPERATMKA